MLPAVAHYGRTAAVRQAQPQVVAAAYARHPERFVGGMPKVGSPPRAVWINEPQDPLTYAALLEAAIARPNGARIAGDHQRSAARKCGLIVIAKSVSKPLAHALLRLRSVEGPLT